MIRISPSPLRDKKWRATLPTGKNVDFGQEGADDYTTHKDPHRMLNYLRRHGGVSLQEYEKLKQLSPSRLHSLLLRRSKSSKEKWSDPSTPGFWSRWLLWSEPSLSGAAKRVQSITGKKVSIEARRKRRSSHRKSKKRR